MSINFFDGEAKQPSTQNFRPTKYYNPLDFTRFFDLAKIYFASVESPSSKENSVNQNFSVEVQNKDEEVDFNLASYLQKEQEDNEKVAQKLEIESKNLAMKLGLEEYAKNRALEVYTTKLNRLDQKARELGFVFDVGVMGYYNEKSKIFLSKEELEKFI